MPRATNKPASRERRKKIVERASGYRGSRHKLLKVARKAVDRAGQYAFNDRRKRKNDFRKLWIARINAGCRAHGISYSRFMCGLRQANIDVNRKMLAEIAATDEASFGQMVERAKAALDSN